MLTARRHASRLAYLTERHLMRKRDGYFLRTEHACTEDFVPEETNRNNQRELGFSLHLRRLPVP